MIAVSEDVEPLASIHLHLRRATQDLIPEVNQFRLHIKFIKQFNQFCFISDDDHIADALISA